MFDQHILLALQQNISFSLKNNFQMTTGQITITTLRALPQLTPHQVRMLCKAQEQAILQNILTVRQLDIYEEIAAVCPQGRDIRTISNEEVDQRIGSKLLLACEQASEDEPSNEQCSREESFFSEIQGDMDMELIEEEPNLPAEFTSMCKIFEMCDNHNDWNSQDILEFN